MDLPTVEAFVAVAEERHFGAAAERLHLVQSSVSAAIARLERELGARLLDRSPRAVALTEAGASVLPEARRLLATADRMRVAAVGRAGLTGTIRFGTFSSLPVLDLPRQLAAFAAEHPAVEVRLTTSASGSTGLANDIRAGRLDLGLVALPPDLTSGLALTPLASYPFGVLLPSGHPLAGRPSIRLAELAREAFVDSPAGFGHRVVSDRAFAAAGVARTVRTEIVDLPSLGAYVAAGLGVAVVPTPLVEPQDGVVVVPLRHPIEWSVALATRPEPSPAVSAFIRLTGSLFSPDA
ncbi:LysR family transcriptional regulator [Amnibacterium kyonggiense]|uniref:DNA-binding transcriptional LysR family regulator n=1 Tax=Amnibacterium kyonggiense TaxID=595671 RepID=A0A4R7FIX8_9MICO|nr:LysR family transcriptional regulator [Amnibacterium kyonggiense]TDS75632.1 DNA-binding transcriptional LysR family regulator [Amnibacterium kyonggiense]